MVMTLFVNRLHYLVCKSSANTTLKNIPISQCRNLTCLKGTSVSPIKMVYSVFGDNSFLTPVVMLHGFLGSRTNWKTLAKKMANDAKCQVYITDARNHGDSLHTTESDYSTMMEDLKHFLHQHGIEKAILVGHSMGGRTAMLLATMHPNLVEKLIAVDISPFSSPPYVTPTVDTIFPVLRNLLSQVPPGATLSKARQICHRMLPKNIPDVGLIDAILVNLQEGENGEIVWRANINMDYRSIIKPLELSEARTYDGPTFFICGNNSVYVRPDEYPSIRKHFPKAVFHRVEGAGHVVNMDKPVEFQELLYKCLGL